MSTATLPNTQPRRLEASFRERIWGTTELGPWFPDSEGAGPDRKIGEVWFEGPKDSPLLVKFIFTSEKLSVQVHPQDAYARAHHHSSGKTEMWYVLAAEPGSKIAGGFRRPVTREQLKAAALSGEVEDLLEWIEPSVGDTFFLPAGTVHAIGSGLTLCEIQQNSDITYRLYDYGRGRDLHLEQALAVSNLEPQSVKQEPDQDLLVDCEHFTTKLLQVRGTKTIFPIPGQSKFIVMVDGTGEILDSPTRAGDVWYISETTEPFEIRGNLRCLVAASNY